MFKFLMNLFNWNKKKESCEEEEGISSISNLPGTKMYKEKDMVIIMQ